MAMCALCVRILLLLRASVPAHGSHLRAVKWERQVPAAEVDLMPPAMPAASAAQLMLPRAMPAYTSQMMPPPQVPFGFIAHAGTVPSVLKGTAAPPALPAQAALMPGMPTDPPGGMGMPTGPSDPAFAVWVANMESKLHNGLAAEIKFLNTLMKQQSMTHAQLIKFKQIMGDLSVKYQASQQQAAAEQTKVKDLESKMGVLSGQVAGLQHMFQQYKQEYAAKWKTTEDSLGALWAQTSQAMTAMSTVHAQAQNQLDALEGSPPVPPPTAATPTQAVTTLPPVAFAHSQDMHPLETMNDMVPLPPQEQAIKWQTASKKDAKSEGKVTWSPSTGVTVDF